MGSHRGVKVSGGGKFGKQLDDAPWYQTGRRVKRRRVNDGRRSQTQRFISSPVYPILNLTASRLQRSCDFKRTGPDHLLLVLLALPRGPGEVVSVC